MTAKQALRAASLLYDFASRLEAGTYSKKLQLECCTLAQALKEYAETSQLWEADVIQTRVVDSKSGRIT